MSGEFLGGLVLFCLLFEHGVLRGRAVVYIERRHGPERVDDDLYVSYWNRLAVGHLLLYLIERSDRYVTFATIVEFIRFPTPCTKRYRKFVGAFHGFDQRVV